LRRKSKNTIDQEPTNRVETPPIKHREIRMWTIILIVFIAILVAMTIHAVIAEIRDLGDQ
jgi:uncharacterized membrane protein YvbJ